MDSSGHSADPGTLSPEDSAGHADVIPVADTAHRAPNDGDLGSEQAELMKEVDATEAEMDSLLAQQMDEAAVLSTLQDGLNAELRGLQDEAWRLQMYVQLESMKRQLALMSVMQSDVNSQIESTTAHGDGEIPEEDLGEDVGPEQEVQSACTDFKDDTEKDSLDDVATLEAEAQDLQDVIDQRLGAIMQQLQAVRREAAAVAEHKALLEEELARLVLESPDMPETLVREAEEIRVAHSLSTSTVQKLPDPPQFSDNNHDILQQLHVAADSDSSTGAEGGVLNANKSAVAVPV